MNLVIVESPTKAKTISKFLNKSFVIESSYGHVRDLPKKELGIDVENNFKPKYVIFRQNQKRITALRKKAEKSEAVYFATDEDREGEAIAWHLQEIFKVTKEKAKRITFHEITKEAILQALKNPRSIDLNLVDAQQARRILDRLVGYKLSPFLWKKIAKGLSAGRVQSVAVRLIVERQREIDNFKPEEYWTIEAEFKTDNSEIFRAKLYKINDKALKKLGLQTKEEVDKILKDIENNEYRVLKIEKKETKKSPPPPFTTSTLQQAANSRFGFSTKQTMVIAQQLYEGIKLEGKNQVGLITYMRTDSFNLADKFLNEARLFIKKTFGDQYCPEKERRFKTKAKGAQEAHEAIRPTNINLMPEEIKQYLDERQFKLYQLIWQRALACQMKDALIDATIIDIKAKNSGSETINYIFRAIGSVIKFDGFLKVYPKKTEENILPSLKINELLELIKLEPLQHFTQPPAYYNEASLVKALEEYGIGRPSTYAPIISTIQERNYIIKEDRKLKPTEIGILVNDVLVEHFPKIVDYQFTAAMEKDLDEIAEGGMDWVATIDKFYQPFKENLEKKEKEISKKEITQEEKTEEKCPKCGAILVIKTGRFGKFLACSNFPECKFTKPLNKNEEPEEKTEEKCPECQKPLVIKHGRFGKFLACSNYPECKFTKPIIKKMDIKCPQCQKGEIIERKTKKRRLFYACSNYPECKFVLWSKPTGEKCPKCGSLLIYGPKNSIKCSKKECDFVKSEKE